LIAQKNIKLVINKLAETRVKIRREKNLNPGWKEYLKI
jgi:hypothetical protein